jgi:hypothetical protein
MQGIALMAVIAALAAAQPAQAQEDPTPEPVETVTPTPTPDPINALLAVIFPTPAPAPPPVLSVMRPNARLVSPKLTANAKRRVRVRVACGVVTPGILLPRNCTGSVQIAANVGGRARIIGREGYDVPYGGIVRVKLGTRGYRLARRHAIPVLVRVTVVNADADAQSDVALCRISA